MGKSGRSADDGWAIRSQDAGMHRIVGPSRGRVAIAAAMVAAVAAVAVFATAGQDGVAQSAGVAQTLQGKYVSVVDSVSPSVVLIRTGQELGSGIVFDTHGDVVTNAHVVAGAAKLSVTLLRGRQVAATVVGTDPSDDLAVVHMTGATPPPVTFADSSMLRVGDIVLAIGNPLGLHASVTEGIVSSLDRSVSESNGVTLTSAIQTSAAINPGNSGGALVDLGGHVIGIPTAAALDPQLGNSQASGIGFAVSSNQVKAVAARILAATSVAAVRQGPAAGTELVLVP
jgi:S1-C subfamily serine protease